MCNSSYHHNQIESISLHHHCHIFRRIFFFAFYLSHHYADLSESTGRKECLCILFFLIVCAYSAGVYLRLLSVYAIYEVVCFQHAALSLRVML